MFLCILGVCGRVRFSRSQIMGWKDGKFFEKMFGVRETFSLSVGWCLGKMSTNWAKSPSGQQRSVSWSFSRIPKMGKDLILPGFSEWDQERGCCRGLLAILRWIGGILRHLQGFICKLGLRRAIDVIEFAVEDFEAEKAHVRRCNTLHQGIPIAMSIGHWVPIVVHKRLIVQLLLLCPAAAARRHFYAATFPETTFFPTLPETPSGRSNTSLLTQFFFYCCFVEPRLAQKTTFTWDFGAQTSYQLWCNTKGTAPGTKWSENLAVWDGFLWNFLGVFGLVAHGKNLESGWVSGSRRRALFYAQRDKRLKVWVIFFGFSSRFPLSTQTISQDSNTIACTVHSASVFAL